MAGYSKPKKSIKKGEPSPAKGNMAGRLKTGKAPAALKMAARKAAPRGKK